MKNTFKKFAGIAAASIMAASMVAPMAMNFTASAADTTITIKDGDSASTSTFWGYLLMTATDGGNGKFSYTVNEKYRAILKAEVGTTETDNAKIDDAIKAYIAGLTDADDMREFADDVYLAIKAAGIEKDEVSDKGVITGTQGYYLIAEKALANTDTDGTMSLVMVDTLDNAGITVNVKKETPKFEKKLKDKNDTTGVETGWQDGADYDIGDEVPFQLTATLPQDYDKYQTYKLVFHDGMEDNVFAFVEGSAKVTSGAISTAIVPTAGTCNETISSGDVCELEFTVDVKATFPDAGPGDTVVIEYKATLEDTANLGKAGNWNAAYLEYSNNPYYTGTGDTQDEETMSETPKDQVVVFTYKTVINKVDGTDANANPKPALAGAGFTLYKNIGGTWTEIKEIEATETGTQFEFVGLDDGDYKLSETQTPQGYNTIADIEFTITAEHDENNVDTPALKTLDGGNLATGDIDTGVITAEVQNKSGTELPSTGGIGTTLFYLGGGAMVAVAGVYLISKKRMKNED